MEREEVSRILAEGYSLGRTAWAMQRAPGAWSCELARATTNSHEAISYSMVRTEIVPPLSWSMLLFEATHSWCYVFSRAWWIRSGRIWMALTYRSSQTRLGRHFFFVDDFFSSCSSAFCSSSFFCIAFNCSLNACNSGLLVAAGTAGIGPVWCG